MKAASHTWHTWQASHDSIYWIVLCIVTPTLFEHDQWVYSVVSAYIRECFHCRQSGVIATESVILFTFYKVVHFPLPGYTVCLEL